MEVVSEKHVGFNCVIPEARVDRYPRYFLNTTPILPGTTVRMSTLVSPSSPSSSIPLPATNDIDTQNVPSTPALRSPTHLPSPDTSPSRTESSGLASSNTTFISTRQQLLPGPSTSPSPINFPGIVAMNISDQPIPRISSSRFSKVSYLPSPVSTPSRIASPVTTLPEATAEPTTSTSSLLSPIVLPAPHLPTPAATPSRVKDLALPDMHKSGPLPSPKPILPEYISLHSARSISPIEKIIHLGLFSSSNPWGTKPETAFNLKPLTRPTTSHTTSIPQTPSVRDAEQGKLIIQHVP
ncbi:hypothetical protein C8Q75DRAFT_347020 [Abortiporus biennis]|nr:hypothetical protein C8Q75DRAFT_347020 [Abortiporus biennis]